MYKFNVFTAAAVLTLAGLPSTGASAFPLPGLWGSAAQPIQQARIVCEPFGRCFRVDAFGRRILVPRREGFPGVGFGRPPAERPFPGGPEFQGGRGFGGPDAGQGRPGRGDEGEGRRNPNGAQGNQRNDGQGQQQNGGQKRRPDATGGNGGNGGNAGGGGQRQQQGGDQNRRRPPQGDEQQ